MRIPIWGGLPLTVWLGMLTLTLLLLTVLSGLRIIKLQFGQHRLLGLSTLASGVIHGILVLLMYTS